MSKAKAAPSPYKLSPEQALLLEQLRGKGYAALPEVRFHHERKWRIDVAVCRAVALRGLDTWTDVLQRQGAVVAVEIHGGVFSRGRHVRGLGFVKDMEKENAMTELGLKVLKFTPQQVRTGEALAQIERCLS